MLIFEQRIRLLQLKFKDTKTNTLYNYFFNKLAAHLCILNKKTSDEKQLVVLYSCP